MLAVIIVLVFYILMMKAIMIFLILNCLVIMVLGVLTLVIMSMFVIILWYVRNLLQDKLAMPSTNYRRQRERHQAFLR